MRRQQQQQQQHQQRDILGSDHMTGPINETFDAWYAHTHIHKKDTILFIQFLLLFHFFIPFHATQ